MNPSIKEVPNEIEVDRHPCADTYTSTKEALMSAGVATESMFPELPKRVKRSPRNIPDDEWWDVRRKRGGLFVVRLHHEYRKPPPEPFTPDMYLIATMVVAEMSINTICECLRGDIDQVNDMCLSNADEIETDLRAILQRIKATRVIQTPRLSIVKAT